MAAISPHLSVRMPTDSSLRAQYDHRGTFKRVGDFASSLWLQVKYTSAFVSRKRTWENLQQCGDKVEWKAKSQALFVLVHGLRSHPAAWDSQLSILKNYPKMDVFAPVVPQKGMCSLEEATKPILPILLDYAQKNPGNPICLLGVSNGTRVITWLETELREKAPKTPVKVSAISGVLFGSSRMNLLNRLGLAKYFYPKALQSELVYGSSKAKELLNRLRAPLPENTAPRQFEFYATTEDLSVPDLESSLPKLYKGEIFHVLHGHSHDSIVTAVAKQQIASCMSWIRLLRSLK